MRYELKRFWQSLLLSQQVFVFVSILLVFVMVISAVMSTALFFRWWEKTYQQQLEMNLTFANDLIRSDILQFRRIALQVFEETFQTTGDRAKPHSKYQSLMKHFPEIQAVVVFDKRGGRAFSLEMPQWMGIRIEQLVPLSSFRYTNEIYEVVIHPGNRCVYLIFGYESEEGKLFAIFSLETMISHFQQLLGMYETPTGVVDEYGNYVFHTVVERVMASEGLGHLSGFREFVRSKEQRAVLHGVSDNLVSYVLMKVEGLPWMIVVEQPRFFWLEVFSQHLSQILLVFLGVLGFSLFVAYGFSRFLARVLRMFMDFSRAILTQMPYEKKFAFFFPEMETFVSTLEHMSSALQKQQEDLRYSRQLIQNVVNSLSEGLMLVRSDGTVIYLNPEGARMLGVSPQTSFETVVRGESARGGFALPLPLLMAIKPYERQYEIKDEVMLYAPDGSKYWLYLQSKDWQDPQGLFLGKMVMLSDITARKQTNQQLLASENRLSAALEAANAMFWDWTIPSDELVLSENWEKKTGKPLPHSLAEWLKEFSEEEEGKIREGLLAYCGGGVSHFTLEHRLPAPEEMWVLNKAHIVERDIFQQPLRVIGVMVDMTTIKMQQKQIEESLAEKEVLLKEIHHRVKNNLQIISSLLSLQGEYIGDETFHRIIRDSQIRVRSMAIVHEKLYQTSSFSIVSFRDYIFDLVDAIQSIYEVSVPVQVDIQAEEIALPLETCIPLGLWLSEAITNAFKYAFRDNPQPRLRVIFGLREKRLLLEVADNGSGMTGDFLKAPSSLGMKLLSLLAQQLRGELRFVNEDGLRVWLEFPRP